MTTVIPNELAKLEHSLDLNLSHDEIAKYNFPNYLPEDILVSSLNIVAKPYDYQEKCSTVVAKGTCHFPTNSRFPELQWEHLAASTLDVIISQAGKIIQTVSSNCNGVALIKSNARIIKPSPLENVCFVFNCRVFVKMQKVWIISHVEFFHDNQLFCKYDMTSAGAVRDYSNIAKERAKEQEMQEALI